MPALGPDDGLRTVFVRLATAAFLIALALHPPETRGWGAALALVPLVLVAGLAWRPGRDSVVLALVSGTGGALLLTSLESPAIAVEPLAHLVLLGATFAIMRAAAPRIPASWLATAAAIAVAAVAAHALSQQLGGLARVQAELAAAPVELPEREVLLERAGEGRSFAAFVTPAALGGWIALVLPLLLVDARTSRGGRRVAMAVAAVAAVAALVASASVTAVAALAAAVLLALWLNPARRALAIGALGALVLLIGSAVALRGAEVLDASARRGPIKLRLANYRAASEMIRDHPLVGVGPGGFAERYPSYLRPGDNETTHVHDLPLELAAEWGVPAGSAATVLIALLLLSPLVRSRAIGGLGPAVGLAAFAVHNLLDFTFFLPSAAWTAACLAGWCHGQAAEDAADVDEDGGATGRLVPWGVALLAVGVAVGAGLSSGSAWGARLAAPEPGRRLELARQATSRAPWSADAALLRARILATTDGVSPNEALAAADRAVRLAPNRAAARAHRAGQRLLTGDGPGALVDLREAVRLHPAEPTYHRDLAVVAERLRRQIEEAPR